MIILKRFYIIFLILTSFSLRLLQPHPHSIYNDFKWRLMYFVEPFLKNVQIHGNKMEGDSFISIADEITSSFTRYAAGLSLSKNDVDEKEIKTFSMYTKMLNIGLNLYKKLVKIEEEDYSFENDVTKLCVKYQFEFLEELKECKTKAAILPITWGGSQPHATTLYIRWHGGDFYDLAFINTGDGLEFHKSFKDPNNVYPFLCQAWIEFEKIPEYEIFDEVAWFLQALIHVNHNYLYIVRDGVESIKNYFYGTILSNFYKYQKEDDNEDAEENNTKLIPMQRSGSCVFSCLMAAFLYHCPDEKTFHLYRLRFGNHFLKEFLEKYQNSPEFISIITDSFETVGRNLFYRLASAQAGHVLQYLEHVLPTEFKHIGLLGKNRLDWIQWKMTNVPKVLQSNHYLIDIIRKSTDVSLSILSILRKYPTTCENSTIHIDERLDTFIPTALLLDFKSISQYDQLMLSSNVPSITLSSRPKRWWNEINSIKLFVDKLVNLTKSSVRCYYNNALDLFQKVGSGLWEWMDSICETDSLRLLESLKLLLFRFLSEKSGPLSFEDVVLLGKIQLAAWKAAVAYDNFQSDPIELSKFHPPNTVQNLIFFHNILSNGRKRWLVQNCFSSNSLKMFKGLISELEDSVNSEVILHPFQAFDSNTKDIRENETYRTEETVRDHFDVNEYCDDILPKLTLHRGLYEKMGKNKIIQERRLSDEYRHRKEIYALISIIFSDSYLMQTQFPQFDLLMNILFGINFVRYNQQIISKSFTPSDPWMASQLSKYSHSIQVRYKFECKYKKSVKLFPCKSDDSFFINLGSTQYLLASSSLEFKHLFYTARHSEASINPSSVVNLESWLNFVKNAKGTELFCNPYFVYLSDRILNLPQFTRTSENKVNLEIAAMYPDGFGLSIINEIFESLFVIIQRDLRTLITKKNSLGVEKKMKAVTKIVELCIMLNRLFHQKKVKSFSDLYSCYLKNSLTCFQHKFPHFTKEECIELQRDTFTFYSQQVLLDHLHYIYDLARKLLISAAQVTFGELETFCDELKKFTEFKYRHGNPAILIFEFRSGKYRLRSEQVKDIELLTSTITSTRDSTQNGHHSVVIQRMMAAGKTLILGTISVIQKALNRNTLSILVPPSSLYQSNTKTMQEISYKYFKRKGENFMFPRLSLSDRTIGKYLDHVIDLITRTMESGDYLILSPNSLHSFLNSYLEWLNAFHNRNDTTICNFSFSVLKQFATVYNIFKQKGSIILDEIDLTMDPRKELNFPTVETESYNMVAVALIVDIFEFTLFDQNIKLAGLDILGNNQASLTSKAYENCRNIILNYIETQLKEKRSIYGHLLFDFNDNIILKAEDVMKFIRNPDMDAEVDWINGLDSTVVDRATVDSFIVLKLHLYIYFEDSLKGTVNQDYGSAGSKRSAIKYAVPYVAANTPSTDSIFSDRWETLSKTLLMAASVPCTVNTAKDVASYLKDILLIEIKSKYCPTRSLLKILIPDIKPEFIDLESEEHFERIHQVLRERSPASMKLLFRYFVKIVFGNMKFHVEQITSNALNMSSMFASVQGYSETIDNVNILPQNVVSDAFVDHMNNEKYNGGIALKLIQDSNDSTVLELENDVFAGTVDKLLREIFIKIADVKSIFAIIDAGAFFKSFRNRQVAEGILSELKHVEAVIYYDESSNQPEFLRRRAGMGNQFVRGYLSSTDADYITVSSQACIDQRFTFYDQRHITGSDIAQPKHAQALMTISPRVLLRDILQGTLRMRLFMTTQHVHLVTTASTREFFYSNLNDLELDGKYKSRDKFEGILVSDILALGSFNEDAKQSSENEKLAFAKIDNEIRSFVLTEISLELESPDIQSARPLGTYLHGFFECARDLFVRSIREDPVQLLRRDVFQESHVVLFEYYRGKVRKLDDFLQNASEVVQDRFKELKERIEAMIIESRKTQTDCLLYYLPDTMQRRQVQTLGTEILMETEMDLQITSHTVTQMRLDQFINRAHLGKNVKQHDMINLELLASNESTILKTTDYYISLKELFKEEHFSSGQRPLVKTTLLSQCENVSVTRDLIEIFDNPQQYDQINHIFTISTRDGSHLLVHRSNCNIKSGSGSGISVYLISIENARSIYSQLKGKNSFYFQGAHFWLCDLSGRVTITNNESTLPASNVLEFLPETRILILDALIFNGSLPQILSNPFTANLYRNVYLKSGDVKHRAIFLLVRMEVLAKKKDILFEAVDPDFVILNTLANGASNAKFFIE